MNKEVAKGFSMGVLAPIIAFLIYVGFHLEVELDTAIKTINRMGTMTHHISLSVFLTNTALFFMQIKMYKDENIVKVKIREPFNQNSFPKAENFMRKTKDKENIFHHIGIYCYEVQTLKKFISFNQSKNELENRLEQLRALDNNIDIKFTGLGKDKIDSQLIYDLSSNVNSIFEYQMDKYEDYKEK